MDICPYIRPDNYNNFNFNIIFYINSFYYRDLGMPSLADLGPKCKHFLGPYIYFQY